jgi:alpha-beta hydrolase superfamily lysophospholipase
MRSSTTYSSRCFISTTSTTDLSTSTGQAVPQSFTHHFAILREVKMHYVTAGSGDTTLVLLHGYPQSWYCWREVITELQIEYRIVAPDLRGLGDTTRPAGGYEKRTIAADVYELLSDHLGLSQYAVAGHDWGGVVAFALAADHPATTPTPSARRPERSTCVPTPHRERCGPASPTTGRLRKTSPTTRHAPRS